MAATGAVATTTAASNGNRSGHRLVLWHGTVKNGKLECLETKQALAHGRIRVGIELATLQVTKELVQSVVSALAIVRLSTLVTLTQGVVDIAI
jgi:hypothetical protein